jgi:hypothetical protein
MHFMMILLEWGCWYMCVLLCRKVVLDHNCVSEHCVRLKVGAIVVEKI